MQREVTGPVDVELKDESYPLCKVIFSHDERKVLSDP